MSNFFLTHKAVEDLSKIWGYTYDTWSELQADKYYALLITSCKKLSEDLGLGKRYTEIEEGIRGYRVGKHIIFYRKTENDKIEVLRFLHEAMDLKSRIRE